MSKPWIAINAQGKVVGRYATPAGADVAYPEATKAGLIKVQYRPRQKKSKAREFPYMGDGRL